MARMPPSSSSSSDIECGPCHSHQSNGYAYGSQQGPPKGKPLVPPQGPPTNFPPPETRRWFPWLVPLIVIADLAMFGYEMYYNNCPDHLKKSECILGDSFGRFSFQPFKENFLLGPSADTLTKLGGLDRELVVDSKMSWRLVACIFLHAGVIHVLLNMTSLLFTGIRLEKDFGFLRVGALFMLSGLGGSVMSCLHMLPWSVVQRSISVGASGALFGLLACMLSELFMNWTLYTNKCCALTTLVIIIAINLGVGFLPWVDNSAHIGGFVTGFFLGFVLLIRPQYGYVSPDKVPKGYRTREIPKYQTYQYVLFVIGSVGFISAYAFGFTKLYGVI